MIRPDSRPIRVLIVDHEALLRTGIRSILGHAPDIEVVAEAQSGAAAVELSRTEKIDVALMDLRMPGVDELAAIAQLSAMAPGIRIVVLTTFIDHDCIARALRAGAVGFVLKDTGPEGLIMAVRAASHGHAILSPQVARRVTDAYLTSEPARASRARHLLSRLTEREREVLVLIGLGLSNADAARRLYLGEGTVKTHVSHILTKLGCQNRVQAAIVAHDAGILGHHLAQTTAEADTRAVS